MSGYCAVARMFAGPVPRWASPWRRSTIWANRERRRYHMRRRKSRGWGHGR